MKIQYGIVQLEIVIFAHNAGHFQLLMQYKLNVFALLIIMLLLCRFAHKFQNVQQGLYST